MCQDVAKIGTAVSQPRAYTLDSFNTDAHCIKCKAHIQAHIVHDSI